MKCLRPSDSGEFPVEVVRLCSQEDSRILLFIIFLFLRGGGNVSWWFRLILSQQRQNVSEESWQFSCCFSKSSAFTSLDDEKFFQILLDDVHLSFPWTVRTSLGSRVCMKLNNPFVYCEKTNEIMVCGDLRQENGCLHFYVLTPEACFGFPWGVTWKLASRRANQATRRSSSRFVLALYQECSLNTFGGVQMSGL